MFLCLLHITTMPKTYTSYRLLLYISLFVARQHYIPHPDRQLVFLFCMYIIINFKTTRVRNMGKNIKNYATSQVRSPGKGREALRQKVPISRLQYGTA